MMKNREIEELKRDIKVLSDSVTELQKNLYNIAHACGMDMSWFTFMNEGRMRVSYGPLTSPEPTLKEQVAMLKDHLKVVIVQTPAVPAKYVLQKKANT